jgi:hypothetical protein
MDRSIMTQFMLVLMFGCFLVPSPALARETCIDCHGQKGAKGYVDPILFEQSVHGSLACTKCHQGITGYPHARITRVNCLGCHFSGQGGAPRKQAQQYEMSVHGKAAASGNPAAPTCETCHGTHAIFPSADTRSATNRKKIPALCSSCHPSEFEEYKKSIHAAMLEMPSDVKSPTCFDCHLEHLTPPTSSARWQLSLIRQCGTCHPKQMSTYHETYHGKVTELGYATVAKCSDCHGSHAIVAVSDPASPLSPHNILTTCRKCHPAATAGFTKFYAHPDEHDRAKYPVLYYTFLFMTMLLIGVFVFFLTHTFLWAYRSLKERMHGKGGD